MAETVTGISWEELKTAIGESFAGEMVDVDEVKQLMSSYQSKRSDWAQYEHFDKHTYTRNLVDQGNGKYNLIVLCWDSGQGSSIHDHADSHCFMKVLQGAIRETRYEWPDNTGEMVPPQEGEEGKPMQVKDSMVYGLDELTYINNSMSLHRVENHTHTDRAVTLHLYSPPIQVCKCFEERTGTSHKCKVTFYSASSCM